MVDRNGAIFGVERYNDDGIYKLNRIIREDYGLRNRLILVDFENNKLRDLDKNETTLLYDLKKHDFIDSEGYVTNRKAVHVATYARIEFFNAADDYVALLIDELGEI